MEGSEAVDSAQALVCGAHATRPCVQQGRAAADYFHFMCGCIKFEWHICCMALLNFERMKTHILSLLILIVLAGACKSNQMGEKVNEPFTSSKYFSNKRYWKSTGSGTSADLNIAKQKAQLEARKNLASEVQTNVKALADQYMKQQDMGDREVFEKSFEQLSREVLNTQLANASVSDQQTFKKENGQFTHYVAMEAHKKDMFRTLKRINASKVNLSDVQRTQIEKMIDAQLAALED